MLAAALHLLRTPGRPIHHCFPGLPYSRANAARGLFSFCVTRAWSEGRWARVDAAVTLRADGGGVVDQERRYTGVEVFLMKLAERLLECLIPFRGPGFERPRPLLPGATKVYLSLPRLASVCVKGGSGAASP